MKNDIHVKRDWHIEISHEDFWVVNSNGNSVCVLLDHKDVFRSGILVVNSPVLLNSLIDIFLIIKELRKNNPSMIGDEYNDDLTFARDLLEFCLVNIP